MSDTATRPRQNPSCLVSMVSETSSQDLRRSSIGIALGRLSEDSRLQVSAITRTNQQEVSATLQQQWQDAKEAMARGAIQAWLWLRQDILLNDFLLADRLREWADQCTGGCWRDHDGRPAALWVRPHLAASLAENFEHVLHHQLPAAAGPLACVQINEKAPRRMLSSPAPQPAPLLLITATRETADRFYTHTALGRSVIRLREAGVDVTVSAHCGNTAPLGNVYNKSVDERHRNHLIAFVHDDVLLEDWHIANRLSEALSHYDMIGVAGNRRRLNGQPAWHFGQFVGSWSPAADLVGCVGHDTMHRKDEGRKVRVTSHYGHGHDRVRLIDGLFMAMRGKTWLDSGLQFDPNFAFDFYDLDLCRQAEQLGLSIGVWPIALTHLSIGSYSAKRWQNAYLAYLSKWKDAMPQRPAHT